MNCYFNLRLLLIRRYLGSSDSPGPDGAGPSDLESGGILTRHRGVDHV